MSGLLSTSGRLPICLHESDTVYGLPTSKATTSAKAIHRDLYLISTTMHRQRGLGTTHSMTPLAELQTWLLDALPQSGVGNQIWNTFGISSVWHGSHNVMK